MQKTDWSTGVEEPDHGKDAAAVVARLRDPQLHEDAVHVLLDGAFGDVQLARDAAVRATLRHQLEHFALTRGEVSERILGAPGGDELLDDRGIDTTRRP